jgi:hypothetical protein
MLPHERPLEFWEQDVSGENPPRQLVDAINAGLRIIGGWHNRACGGHGEMLAGSPVLVNASGDRARL